MHELKASKLGSSEYADLNPFDGWGNEFQFCMLGCSKDDCAFYIRSAGRDGQWDAQRYICWARDAYDYNADIVIGKDRYYRWPNVNFVDIDPEWKIPHKAMDHKVVP